MQSILTKLVAYADAHPARVISALAAAVVFVAAKAGIVVPQESVVHALEFVIPTLIAGEATHRRVTPAK